MLFSLSDFRSASLSFAICRKFLNVLFRLLGYNPNKVYDIPRRFFRNTYFGKEVWSKSFLLQWDWILCSCHAIAKPIFSEAFAVWFNVKTCEAVFVGSNPARNTIKAPSVMKVAGNSPLKFLLFRKSADRCGCCF